MSKLQYSIHIASWSQDQNTLMAIRETVFVVEQGVPIEMELDEYDPTATHFIVSLQSSLECIATARILDNGHIGRMAVLKPYRAQGIGSALLEKLIEYAQQQQMQTTHLNAQCSASGFYQRLGFQQTGDVFDDAGIPHIRMVLQHQSKLKTSPGINREQRISDEGLKRLEKQLQSGARISALVQQQWIKRYGDAATELFKLYL